MRLLVDEALQDAVALALGDAGHDTTHVRVLGLAGHTDDDVMALALTEQRVLVTTHGLRDDPRPDGCGGPERGPASRRRRLGERTVAAVLEVLPRVEGDSPRVR